MAFNGFKLNDISLDTFLLWSQLVNRNLNWIIYENLVEEIWISNLKVCQYLLSPFEYSKAYNFHVSTPIFDECIFMVVVVTAFG